jgi:hypothetical protein
LQWQQEVEVVARQQGGGCSAATWRRQHCERWCQTLAAKNQEDAETSEEGNGSEAREKTEAGKGLRFEGEGQMDGVEHAIPLQEANG